MIQEFVVGKTYRFLHKDDYTKSKTHTQGTTNGSKWSIIKHNVIVASVSQTPAEKARGYACVGFEGDSGTWNWCPDDFEEVITDFDQYKFKVGDRIRGNGNNTYMLTGKGVICIVQNIKSGVAEDIQVQIENGKTSQERDLFWVSSQKFDLVQPFNNCWFSPLQQQMKTEEQKMNKPETQMEKEACKQAINSEIQKVTDRKAEEYKMSFQNFLSHEKNARQYRAQADELKEKLGITAAQMKEIFE
jgi:hypothetical protein